MTPLQYLILWVVGTFLFAAHWYIVNMAWREVDQMNDYCAKLARENALLRAELEFRNNISNAQLACRDVAALVMSRN